MFAWNTLITLPAVGLCIIAIDVFTSHRAELAISGNMFVFLTGIANDWTVLAALGLLLAQLSTAPLHRRPHLTRFVTFVVCGLFAFHFPSLRFKQENLIGVLIASTLLSPLLLFGCGLPHAFARLLGQKDTVSTAPRTANV